MTRRIAPATFLAGLLLAATATAQESASFKLYEHVFNAGGHPGQGTTLASASFEVSLDAIGDGVTLPALSSGSYQAAAGFVPAYPPPGEVTGLLFTSAQTLIWDAEPSAGVYNFYRALVSTLAGSYGDCQQQDLPQATTIDADIPPLADGFFYLVTAENLIAEEGTKGRDSNDLERNNAAPCP